MSNDTQVMTLTEFLLARIAEDEELLRNEDRVYGGGGEVWTNEALHRGLRECEAKRQILEHVAEGQRCDIGCGEGHAYDFDEIERALALPYADHPDYREEWGHPECRRG